MIQATGKRPEGKGQRQRVQGKAAFTTSPDHQITTYPNRSFLLERVSRPSSTGVASIFCAASSGTGRRSAFSDLW